MSTISRALVAVCLAGARLPAAATFIMCAFAALPCFAASGSPGFAVAVAGSRMATVAPPSDPWLEDRTESSAPEVAAPPPVRDRESPTATPKGLEVHADTIPDPSPAQDDDGAPVATDPEEPFDASTDGWRWRSRKETMADPVSAKKVRRARARIIVGSVMIVAGAGTAAGAGMMTFALWAVGDDGVCPGDIALMAAVAASGPAILAGGAVLVHRGERRRVAERWVPAERTPQAKLRVRGAPWATTTGAGMTVGVQF